MSKAEPENDELDNDLIKVVDRIVCEN